MSGATLASGDCDIFKPWFLPYDGDGARVKQVYTKSIRTLTTYDLRRWLLQGTDGRKRFGQGVSVTHKKV